MTIWFGKIIGMILGLIVLGPVGLVIGYLIGQQLDKYLLSLWQQGHWDAQNVFFNTTFKVMGYLAKADGRVSEREIQIARSIMQRMGLNEQQRLKAIELFNQGRDGNIDLNHALYELKQACHGQGALLRMFLEIQFQAALADGFLSTSKQRILQQICSQLGVTIPNFAGFSNQRQHYSHQQTFTGKSTLDKAYSLLNIAKTASNADVKKAYRKLMSQHHPDKLVSKGLPESMIKLATEKTQQIQAAYDQICAARGM